MNELESLKKAVEIAQTFKPSYMVKLTIKRASENNIEIFFESPYMVQLFSNFIEELIENVKKKTLEEASTP